MFFYITEFYLQHVLQFNYNVHVYTLVILLLFFKFLCDIYLLLFILLTMDRKPVRNM